MRQADMEVGRVYALLMGYGELRKVRVVETGLSGRYANAPRNLVRVEVVAGPPLDGGRCRSRDIRPWGERHDEQLAREEASRIRERQMERISKRLGILVEPTHGRRVWLFEDDFFELCKRLEVETT